MSLIRKFWVISPAQFPCNTHGNCHHEFPLYIFRGNLKLYFCILAGNGACDPLEAEVGPLCGDTKRLPGAPPQDDLRGGLLPGEGSHEGHQGQGRHHDHPLCDRVQVKHKCCSIKTFRKHLNLWLGWYFSDEIVESTIAP